MLDSLISLVRAAASAGSDINLATEIGEGMVRQIDPKTIFVEMEDKTVSIQATKAGVLTVNEMMRP